MRIAFGVLLLLASPLHAEDGVAFFESKIRPVLVEHCFRCHSEAKKSQKGDLYLDSRAAMLKGGDSGPAIVPGKSEASLILQAIRHTGDLKMPPKVKLPDAVIADFAKWIELGAPYPTVKVAGIDSQAANQHWAFQPLGRPVPPTIAEARTSIDAFVLTRLREKGFGYSSPADKRTLIRRATFDLIGLPPTPEEIDAFVHDDSPDAFARVIDRLLASLHYGERWGRHWLDLARFADTKDGVLMYGDDRVRPFAYTYRDYVIRAFNADTPFDRFVHEQLAADQLDLGAERWRLAAMGFLTLGRMFDNNIHDVIDDRIDTVTRGLIGMTVSCARCHDHKYDPIPIADYYSLYGVFASSETPIELPLLDPAGNDSPFEKQTVAKRRELQQFVDAQYQLLLEAARQRVGDYLIHAATTPPDPLETAIFFLSLQPTDLRPPMIARWRRFLAQRAQPDDPIFAPWHDVMKIPEAELSGAIDGLRPRWRTLPMLNPLVRDAFDRAKVTNRAEMARVYGDLFRQVYDASKKAPAASPAHQQLLEIVIAADSPAYFPKSQTRDHMSRGEKDAFGGKLQELDRLAVQAKDAPPRAMVLVDAEKPYAPRIFHRGDPSRPTESVPRQFLKVATPGPRQPFPNGSGRLDLARAITASDNPLTARVFVNRVWMHHFGEPLVENPSDFGLRTPRPAQPELLDWLARTFIEKGWSIKQLHRTIMLSAAYQQASFDRPDCRAIDPENRLLWRMNRRRLDLESMRDAMLAVSGRLDDRLGGRPVDVVNDPSNGRRTVYGIVDRQSLPGVFRAFDFASPDQSAERRTLTTVPQQAMFGMNAPFVMQQAKSLAARSEVTRESDPQLRIKAIYRMTFGREPTANELDRALAFVSAKSEGSTLDPLAQLAQVLILTNEFLFVD